MGQTIAVLCKQSAAKLVLWVSSQMNYVPALSGLRAIACIAVVLFHSKVSWAGGGYLGVDVFFVLSGYLTVSILNRGNVSWFDVARFIERRVMRILPLLVAVCLSVGLILSVTSVLSVTSDGASVSRELVSTIGFFSNFALASGAGPDYMIHSWSVSSEMQFYVIIAVIFASVSNLNRAVLLPVFLATFALLTGMRFLAFYDENTWSSIYFSPVLRLSGLFLGGAIALVSTGFAARIAPFGWLGLSIVVLGFFNAVHLSAMSFTIWSTTVEIASALLILSLVSRPDSRVNAFLSGKRLEMLGLWSYGIYLWHYPVARVLREIVTPESAAILTLAVCIPLSAVSFRLIEERYRSMRFSDAVLGRKVSS